MGRQADYSWHARHLADHPPFLSNHSPQGTGMVGVPGIASAIFSTVRDAGINVIMISQVRLSLYKGLRWSTSLSAHAPPVSPPPPLKSGVGGRHVHPKNAPLTPPPPILPPAGLLRAVHLLRGQGR